MRLNLSKGQYFSNIFLQLLLLTIGLIFYIMTIWAPPRDSEISSPTLWSETGNNWCSIKDRCATILCKNNPNGLANDPKKHHCFPSTQFCFSFFWYSKNGKSRIFQIMLLLQFWSNRLQTKCKEVLLVIFINPETQEKNNFKLSCPTKWTNMHHIHFSGQQ